MSRDLIKSLDVRQQCRDKLSVWFGSRENYLHGFREVMANASDEISNNFDNGVITVNLSDDLKTISVEDTGRGIPIGGTTNGTPNYVLLFETLFSGTNYDNNDNNKETTGTNGCGTCVLNHTSTLFSVTSWYGGMRYGITYKNGNSEREEMVPEQCDPTLHGTKIEFTLDETVYTETTYSLDEILDICDKFSAVNNRLTINVGYCGDFYSYHYNSIEEYFDKEITNSSSDKIIGPNKLFDNENEKNRIEFILCSSAGDVSQLTFLNNTYLKDGGSIYDGIIDGIRIFANKHAKDKNLYLKNEKSISNKDVESAVSFVCSIFSTNVEYGNQTKFYTAKKLYKDLANSYVQEQLEIFKIENPSEFDKFVGQILINMRARAKSSRMMENIKKKLTEDFSIINKAKGLIDCRSKDIKENRLFICEGRSALSGLAQARNSDTDALFAIRGKILNCLKADYDTIFKNEVVVSILRILGCGVEISNKSNKEFNMYDPSKLKYGTIVIGVDADPDGKNIRALLLTLFYRLLPSLITDGRIQFVLAPLFEIEVANEGTYFATTIEEKDNILEKFKGKKVEVNRCKGLGENSVEASAQTLMNPNYSGLHTVTMEDVEKAMEHFELFMGTDVGPRKQFIGDNFNIEINDSYNNSVEVAELLVDDCMEYSTYTVTDRALPSIDGFKPSQRRVLYSMYKQGLFHNKKRTKSANVSGEVMKLHPHGSTYSTSARMARNDSMNIPLLDGKGSFGLHGSQYIESASERYTELRLGEIASHIFNGVDKGLVPMVDNYDNSQKEPALLPVELPLILINPTIGIAVGFSSNICGYNLKEVCYNTAKMMRGEQTSVLVPEFSTGALIVNDENTFLKLHTTGTGTIRQRAKYHVVDNKIIVTEIPYLSTIEAIEEKVISLVKNGDIKQIVDINNYTDLNGLNITIELKKGADPKAIMDILYKDTPLENTFSCNFTMLIDGKPVTLGAKGIMEKWCEFRIGTAKKRLENDILKINKELEILYGYRAIANKLDTVISIIQSSPDEASLKSELNKNFNLNDTQISNIGDLKLRSLSKENINKQLGQIENLENQKAQLSSILDNETILRNMLSEQLEALGNKYGRDRVGELIEAESIPSTVVATVPDYNVKLFGTSQGYIKKVPLTGLKASNNRLKEGDDFIFELNCKNNGELLVFTNIGNCYKCKLNDLKDTKMADLGTYLPIHLNMNRDEYIVGYSATNDFIGSILLFYADNRMAKVNLGAYKTKTNRKVLANSLYLGSNLLKVITITEDVSIKITTFKNKEKIINTCDFISKKSRDTQGVVIYGAKADSIKDIKML